MNEDIITKVENFAKKYYKHDQTLWKDHIRLVREYAIKLAKIEKCDALVIEIASILHDIGKYDGRDGHAERSYELSKEFLKRLELSEKQKKLILKCILKHGSKHAVEDNEIEVKVIQCADALGTIFDDDWQEYSRKTVDKQTLLGLFDKTYKKINLKSAKKIAKPKVEKLRKIVLSM